MGEKTSLKTVAMVTMMLLLFAYISVMVLDMPIVTIFDK